MFVKQISVFLENRQGRLEEWTTLLGQNGVDLIALSIADTTDFGILRAIVNDNEKAIRLMHDSGFTASLVDVLAVAVPDAPDGLARVLRLIKERDISIEYLYSLVRRVGSNAIIIFRVDRPEDAAGLLEENGVRLLTHEQIINGSV